MRFRESVMKMQPYTVEKDLPKIRLDKNESPFDVPLRIKERVLADFLDLPLNRYPEIDSETLRREIANDLGLEAKVKDMAAYDRVFLASGSDALLPEIISLFDIRDVVTFAPTFSMYGFYAGRRGIKHVEIPLDSEYNIPDGIADDLKGEHLVFICSPNNPTGNDIPRESIETILKTGVPVVLDQAYVEFSDNDYLDLLETYDNLIVLRTFSKAFGISGLRVGYAVASEPISRMWKRIQSPFSLNSFSARMAHELITHKDLVNEQIQIIKEERDRLYEEFQEIAAVRSSTNFILFNTDAYDDFKQNGVAVRRFNGRLKGKIRVTIGTKEENDIVRRILRIKLNGD